MAENQKPKNEAKVAEKPNINQEQDHELDEKSLDKVVGGAKGHGDTSNKISGNLR